MSEARYRAKARAEAEEYTDPQSTSDPTSLASLCDSTRGEGEAVATVADIDIVGETGRGILDLEVGIGIDDFWVGVDWAVATVVHIDGAGEGGNRDLDVVGVARVFGMLRGRRMGIRVGLIEELAEGKIDSGCEVRPELGIGVVLDEERSLDQSEAEVTVLFVGVISVPCFVSVMLSTFDGRSPDLIGLITPEPGGRIVVLLTTLGDPGVTPGSCN